jgi:hypothetical protein
MTIMVASKRPSFAASLGEFAVVADERGTFVISIKAFSNHRRQATVGVLKITAQASPPISQP